MSEKLLKRKFPNPKDFQSLLKFKKVQFSPRKRRLANAHSIADLRNIAKKTTPSEPFDYTDGGADDEISMQRARDAFREIEFQPRILEDVSKANLKVDLFGKTSNLPFGIAPTGFTRMMHSEGEYAGATAAAEAGIPFSLSTMGTRSIEEVEQVAPTGRNWFQLYMWKDRERSQQLIQRAAQAGYDTLMVTVDVPVAGNRMRDKRNGMTIPPTLTAKTLIGAIPRVEWWWNFLTTDPLVFASLDTWDGTVAELLDFMFDPTVQIEDLQWIRQQWTGKLIVKGIQTVADARRVVDAGADAVLLSNHGGRQLDRAPVPFLLLPDVVKEVGKDVPVHVDTGILSGMDIVACFAQGASFTYIGRAYLYGLMAGGVDGVRKSIEILESEVSRTMKLVGVHDLRELEPEHLQLLTP
mgnify:CR=1 FL=1